MPGKQAALARHLRTPIAFRAIHSHIGHRLIVVMLVQIEPAGPSGVATWAMLELQGEIERTDGSSLEEAFDVGTLSTSSSVSDQAGSVQLAGRDSQATSLRHSSSLCYPPRTGLYPAAHWLSPTRGQARGAEETLCSAGQGGRTRRLDTLQGKELRWVALSPCPSSTRVYSAGSIFERKKVGADAFGSCPPPPGRQPSRLCLRCSQVVGVVRDKLLFKARPRALITKPEGPKK